MTPLVVVLSSPSGAGKSTVARRLLAERADTGYSVSATTRQPRSGEVAGEAYHFLTEDEFAAKVAAGEFLEHAVYNGRRYGTLASEVRRVIQSGRHALLDIEVVGARAVRERFANSLLIFIVPPSGAILAERLRKRGSEDESVIAARLTQGLIELEAAVEYDFVVVNDDLELTLKEVNAILDVESRRTSRQRSVQVLLDRISSEVAAQLANSAQAG